MRPSGQSVYPGRRLQGPRALGNERDMQKNMPEEAAGYALDPLPLVGGADAASVVEVWKSGQHSAEVAGV